MKKNEKMSEEEEKLDLVTLVKEVLECYVKSRLNRNAHRAKNAIEESLDESNARRYLQSLLTLHVGDLTEGIHKKISKLLKFESRNVKMVKLRREVKNLPVVMWKGDITTLDIDCIVNAANSGLCGCFRPFHMCIDNVIHSKAGPRLREECASWNVDFEPPGLARISKAYELPCKFVMHTVGPIYPHNSESQNKKLLESCYKTCLDCAMANKVRSIAFCCVSTGEFQYPNEDAAHIAIQTVKKWIEAHKKDYEFDLIVFNVFKDVDDSIYKKILPKYFPEINKKKGEEE